MTVNSKTQKFSVSELAIIGRLDRECLCANEGAETLAILSKLPEQGHCSWVLSAAYHDGGLSSHPFQAIIKILDPTRMSPGVHPWDLAKAEFSREVTILTRLQHPNIVRYIGSGRAEIECNGRKVDTLYYVLEKVEGETMASASDGLKREQLPGLPQSWPQEGVVSRITAWLDGTLEALDYLFDQNIAHLDIHEGNILIGRDDRARLIDFGKALFAGDKYPWNKGELYPSGPTVLGHPAAAYSGVGGDIHPQIREVVERHKLNNTLDTEKFKEDLRALVGGVQFPRFDLFAVGKLFARLIDMVTSHVPREHTPALQALNHLAQQLVDLNKGATTGFSAAQARATAARLRTGVYASQVRQVRLAGKVNVKIPDLSRHVVDSCQFQRLRNVRQLALTDLVYPSATHTRFSHSLGVFHMALRYAESLSATTAEGRVAITQQDIESLRLGALIHDIGHYPFAHYFEELHEGGDFSLGNGDKFSFRHATIGEAILDDAESDANGDIGARALVDARKRFNELKSGKLGGVAKGVIDSSIDCDKLDYLLRDGHACGVPYADAIDVERFLSSLCVVGSLDNPDVLMMAVSEKGIAPVESIMIARVHMFTEVYWHKTSRAIAAMLKEAMMRVTRDDRLTKDELRNALMKSTDAQLLDWLSKRLVKNGQDAAADWLIWSIEKRRAPHRRVLTLSSAWEAKVGDSNASLYERVNSHIQHHRRLGKTPFAVLCQLRDKLIELVRGDVRTVQQWDIILDMPPVEQLIHADEPEIIFNDRDKTRRPLRRVSELLFSADEGAKDENRRGRIAIGVALERARRFRVFASRRLLGEKFFNCRDANKIRQSFETWLSSAVTDLAK